MKTALITGITGQDGSYLAELLLREGYRVCGIVRRQSVAEHQSSRISGLDVETVYGDLTDYGSLVEAVKRFKPDLVFNLGAQSHVRISFDVPQYTAQVNGVGVLNMLEAVRLHAPADTRFYQASSSEMFGLSIDAYGYQRETTRMNPTSPYGVAKVFGYNIVRHYRRAYGMFAANGILFNHTSPRRGANFVEQKIVRGAVAISQGRADSLTLGNLDAKRDWGSSPNYVDAMLRILQHRVADDFVIATGKSYSVRDILDFVFEYLKLMPWQQLVKTDARYMRPEELPALRGDARKARERLGWVPRKFHDGVLDEMIEKAVQDGTHLVKR